MVFLNGYLWFQFIKFLIYFLIGCTNKKSKRNIGEPLVSIIIPAYNEEVGIGSTIESVLENDYENKEIIVVNDGSTDNTLAVAEGYGVTVIDKNNGGKYDALNRGIIESTGEIIVTIDGDCYLDSMAITNLVNYFADSSIDAVAGKVEISNKGNLIELAQFYEYSAITQMNCARGILKATFNLPGALTAFRGNVVDKGLKFSGDTKTEDFDFSLQLIANGYKLAYAEDCVCYTECAGDLRSLIKQRVRWRHGGLLALKKNIKSIYTHSQNNFLKFVEMPLMILGIVELLLTPVILVIVYSNLATMFDIAIILATMPILSVMFIKYTNWADIAKSILMIPLVQLMALIEFYALIISIYKLSMKKDVKWQSWKRKGIKR